MITLNKIVATMLRVGPWISEEESEGAADVSLKVRLTDPKGDVHILPIARWYFTADDDGAITVVIEPFEIGRCHRRSAADLSTSDIGEEHDVHTN